MHKKRFIIWLLILAAGIPLITGACSSGPKPSLIYFRSGT